MTPETSPPTSGRALIVCTVLGTFVGLLLGKLPIGLLVGFFIGLILESQARKSASGKG